jgi:predicted transcriptional regulator
MLTLTELTQEKIDSVVNKAINKDMEKDGSITEIEEKITRIEYKGYEYDVYIRVSRVMEDQEEEGN